MQGLGFTPLTAGVLAVSLGAALAYLFVWLRRPQSAAKSLVKTTAIGALAALCVVDGAPWLLIAALGLSALGDFAISREGRGAFLAGLGAFLVAHIAYILLFLSVSGGFEGWRIVGGVALIGYAAIFARWLWPHLGDMRGAVLVYILAIGAMGLAALAAPLTLWPILIGGALFVVSDSVLAAETFVFKESAPRRWTAPVIWSTYYAAQTLIASAWICSAFAPG